MSTSRRIRDYLLPRRITWRLKLLLGALCVVLSV